MKNSISPAFGKAVRNSAPPKIFTAPAEPKNVLAKLSPVPVGLTVVMLRDANLINTVRTALTQQLLVAGCDLGLQFDKVSFVKSLCAGSTRMQEALTARLGACGSTSDQVHHEFKSLGTGGDFNWCNKEGLAALLPLIKPKENPQKSCWIVLVQSKQESAVQMVNALQLMRQAAGDSGRYVMVIIVFEAVKTVTNLAECCDEYIEIDACEADNPHDVAFSIDCHGLRGLDSFSQGKKMCSVGEHEGRITHTYRPFVAASLKNRHIWLLRGAGESLAEIGAFFEVDKSNIWRVLKTMPRPVKAPLPKGWMDQVAEYLGLDDDSRKKRIKPTAEKDDLGNLEF